MIVVDIECPPPEGISDLLARFPTLKTHTFNEHETDHSWESWRCAECHFEIVWTDDGGVLVSEGIFDCNKRIMREAIE